MGRGTETRKRPHVVSTRLDAGELARFRKNCEAAGLLPADYVRAAILSADPIRKARLPKIDRALLADLMAELGAVGNNLNQLAKRYNMDKQPAPAELVPALEAVQQLRNAILPALGIYYHLQALGGEDDDR